VPEVVNPNTFVTFPSYLVPASDVPITKIAEREKELDEDLRVKYAKLTDILKTSAPVEKQPAEPVAYGTKGVVKLVKSRAQNTVEDKIHAVEEKKKALYSGNEQWKWGRGWMDAGISYWLSRNNSYDDLMYSYMDSRVPEADFNHITQLYAGTLGKQLPAYLRQVNQIPATNNRLMGELDSMGLRYSVSVINTEAVNDKLDEYANEMADKLTRAARQSGFNKLIGTPLEDNDAYPQELPKEIDDMSFTNYKIDKEVMVKRGLDYLVNKQHSALKFKLVHQGARNYFGTGTLAFYVWDSIEDPEVKAIDSRNLFYILGSDNPFIQNGILAGEYFPSTAQEIVDNCPEMSPTDVAKLQDWQAQYATAQQSPSFLDEKGRIFVKTVTPGQPLYLNCWRMNWRASKRMRVRIIENKYDLDNPHLKYVDDKENTDGALYVYRYIDEIWEGQRYGTDIYYQLRPIPNQHIVGDYVSRKTLNFVGLVDPNPSINQLQQPFESLRMQAFYAIERLMAQTKGKVAFIDRSTESDSEDNHYNAAVYGTWYYNSAKEPDQQLVGLQGAKQINKPEIQDWGISTAVNDLMRFIQFLDINVNQLTGLTGSRKGEIKSDTGLGQMQESNLASSMSTQPYFTNYFTVVGMTLEKLCEQMQRSWANKEVTKYFLGEDGWELLRLMPEQEWFLPRYGISIENGANDLQVQANIIKLAETLMPIQNEPEMALALVKMQNANSAKEAEEIFKKGIDALKKIKKKTDAEEELQQAKMQMQKLEQENEALKNKLTKTNATITAAQINSEGRIEETKLKLENKGELQDAKKSDKIDEILAQHETEPVDAPQ